VKAVGEIRPCISITAAPHPTSPQRGEEQYKTSKGGLPALLLNPNICTYHGAWVHQLMGPAIAGNATSGLTSSFSSGTSAVALKLVRYPGP